MGKLQRSKIFKEISNNPESKDELLHNYKRAVCFILKKGKVQKTKQKRNHKVLKKNPD